jgi:cytochrome P450
MAGSDTTVTALRATLLFIITNPQIHSKVRKELETAKNQAKLSSPVVADSEVQALPYLLACIRESLRIWPPSFGLMQKVVPKGGDHINGLFVPEGTRIGHCTWGILRDTKVFGQDAEAYRPERWLEGTPTEIQGMKRSADLLFGAGRYQCLGKTIAFLELRKCLVTVSFRLQFQLYAILNIWQQLINLYDINVVDPTMPWKSVAANGMFLQSHMFLRMEKRKDADVHEKAK